MEPDGLRESPAGSGGPEPGDWREETPGEEAEEKDRGQKGRARNGGNAQNLETAGGEFEKDGIKLKEKTENENGDENNIDYNGEEDKKYEEELDPRIQVRKDS